MKMTTTQHAVLLSSPGMGHLRPIIELGKLLAIHHNFKVTIFFVSTRISPDETQFLKPITESKLVDVIIIPAPDISALVNTEAKMMKRIRVIMREIRPAFASMLASLTPKPTVLIFDFFATESINIAQQVNLPKYVYSPSSAWFLALTTYCTILDKEIEGEYVAQTEPFRIPGCKPLRPDDVVDPMLERTDPDYQEYRSLGEEIPLFDGVLTNTWEDLEAKSLEAFNEDGAMKKVLKVPVYAIGPLARTVEPDTLKCREYESLFKWLDQQPAESVLYISFGSGGAIPANQINELAWGLESSRQRFIWVLRPPQNEDEGADKSYFSLDQEDDDLKVISKYLPTGFVDRNHSKNGFILPKWGPQVEILSHGSIGGFLSHCGWNSTLESLQSGVPMIAWPLYAEQRMNATMLVEEFGVAIRSKELPCKELVKREEIEEMVKLLLDDELGRRLRKKAKELQVSGQMALCSESGSSFKSLSQFIRHYCS